jgi:transposase
MMRPPATIKDWLSLDEMFQWVHTAPDESTSKCRMAIWLTHTGKIHAEKVAAILGVSKQAIWLWIRQYNDQGPSGLERHGRGGRRWGFLSQQEETELMVPLIRGVRSGHFIKAAAVQRMVEDKLQHKVSKSYIYKLLHRHGWADIPGQSLPKTRLKESPDTFSKLSKPWQRRN